MRAPPRQGGQKHRNATHATDRGHHHAHQKNARKLPETSARVLRVPAVARPCRPTAAGFCAPFLMRPHRSHFSIGRKTALEAWKFLEGDNVVVTTGRSIRAPYKPGYKGAKGVITRVYRDPRNPRVTIENVTVRLRLSRSRAAFMCMMLGPWFCDGCPATQPAARCLHHAGREWGASTATISRAPSLERISAKASWNTTRFVLAPHAIPCVSSHQRESTCARVLSQRA